MTIREVWENVLIDINKKKAPAMYVEDFNYFLRTAIQDHMNTLYALYETTQQLDDDLQNLLRHIIIDTNSDMPFPFNISNLDGTPFISFNNTFDMVNTSGATSFPTHYVSSLNGATNYSRYSDSTSIGNIIGNNIFRYIGNAYTVLNQLIVEGLNDGDIIKIEGLLGIEDYRRLNNTNNLDFGFELGSPGEQIMIRTQSVPGVPLIIFPPTITVADNLSFKYDANRKMFIQLTGASTVVLDENRIMIESPNDYWHLLELATRIQVRNNIECDNWRNKSYGTKRLTANRYTAIRQNSFLKPKYKRPYHKLHNNLKSVYPKFEVIYSDESENNLVQLNEIEMIYLKEPKRYELTEEDLVGDDNTESLEFQRYINEEIVSKVVKLILENNGNPRQQTYEGTTDSNILSRSNSLK